MASLDTLGKLYDSWHLNLTGSLQVKLTILHDCVDGRCSNLRAAMWDKPTSAWAVCVHSQCSQPASCSPTASIRYSITLGNSLRLYVIGNSMTGIRKNEELTAQAHSSNGSPCRRGKTPS